MPGELVALLRCPVCAGGLADSDGALRCPNRHSFDIARQGYVSLFGGAGRRGEADTAEMVQARADFLEAGHFRPLAEAVAEEARAAAGAAGAVVDLGAGTGYHLAHVLDALPGRAGIAVDASAAALRRAARAHPRAAAIGADAWRELPLGDGAAALVLSVFAPRNPAEIARILAPGGSLIAVTPTTRHLYELVGPLGLLSVPGEKAERLEARLSPQLELEARRGLEYAMFLSRDEAAALARMGPSAWHLDEGSLAERIAHLAEPTTVTASVTLSRYVRART